VREDSQDEFFDLIKRKSEIEKQIETFGDDTSSEVYFLKIELTKIMNRIGGLVSIQPS